VLGVKYFIWRIVYQIIKQTQLPLYFVACTSSAWPSSRSGRFGLNVCQNVSSRFRACVQKFFATTDTFVASNCWSNRVKSSIKTINCESFSHAYFAAPPMPCSYTHHDSVGKFGFRASKINVGPGSGFKMRPVYNSGACTSRKLHKW